LFKGFERGVFGLESTHEADAVAVLFADAVLDLFLDHIFRELVAGCFEFREDELGFDEADEGFLPEAAEFLIIVALTIPEAQAGDFHIGGADGEVDILEGDDLIADDGGEAIDDALGGQGV
jgi:hypothetical protein